MPRTMANCMNFNKVWILTHVKTGFRSFVFKLLVILLICSVAVNIVLLGIGNRPRADSIALVKRANVNKVLENSKQRDFVDFKVKLVDSKVKANDRNIKQNVASSDKDEQNVAINNKDKQNVVVEVKEKQNVAIEVKEKQNVAIKDKDKQNVAIKDKDKQNVAIKDKDKQNVAINNKDKQNVAIKDKDKQNVAINDKDKQNVAINDKDKQNVDKNKNVYKVNNNMDKACNEISPVSNNLIKPKMPSNMSNWGFKNRIQCPAFSIDKHPGKRNKIVLQCSGQKPTLATAVARSTTDIETVKFGNSCLAKIIDNCCKGKQPVPNVIHYIWYADKELGFFQFVSFMSALRFVRPCLFLIHGNYIPRGKYWDYFINIAPNVIHVKRDKPSTVFGHKLAFEEHASDIMRIEALKLYGGIYLDFDEIVLRPLEPLRKYEYTQGHERNVTLGSQLVMSKKNATFLNLWYNSYKNDYKAEWAWNALWVPERLSRQFPKLIHVEGYNFTRPNWQHVDQIFNKNYDWSTNYGMHFYVRWYTNYTDIAIIRKLNTTLGAVCRHVLFGNKELCT